MNLNCCKKIGIALSIILAFAVCFVGCQKDNDDSFELIAPSGEIISKSLVTLTKDLSQVIKSDFKILNIEYLPVDVGYVANITYELSDGTIKSLIRTNFPVEESHGMYKSSIVRQSSIVRLKNGNEDNGGPVSVTITCDARQGCSCCNCYPVSVWDMNAGTVTYSCGPCGGDCSMTSTQN